MWKLYVNGKQQVYQDFKLNRSYKNLDVLRYANRTFYSNEFFNDTVTKGLQAQLYLDNCLVFIGWEMV